MEKIIARSYNDVFNLKADLLTSFTVKDNNFSSLLKSLTKIENFDSLSFQEIPDGFLLLLAWEGKRKGCDSDMPSSLLYKKRQVKLSFYNLMGVTRVVELLQSFFSDIKKINRTYYVLKMEDNLCSVFLTADVHKLYMKNKHDYLVSIDESQFKLIDHGKDDRLLVQLRNKNLIYKIPKSYSTRVKKMLKSTKRGKCYLYLTSYSGQTNQLGGVLWENDPYGTLFPLEP